MACLGRPHAAHLQARRIGRVTRGRAAGPGGARTAGLDREPAADAGTPPIAKASWPPAAPLQIVPPGTGFAAGRIRSGAGCLGLPRGLQTTEGVADRVWTPRMRPPSGFSCTHNCEKDEPKALTGQLVNARHRAGPVRPGPACQDGRPRSACRICSHNLQQIFSPNLQPESSVGYSAGSVRHS